MIKQNIRGVQKWASLGMLALSTALLLPACGQEDELLSNTEVKQEPIDERIIGAPGEGEFRFEMEADAPLLGTEEGARAGYYLDTRAGYDQEFYPKLRFKMGEKHSAILIFARKQVKPSDHKVVFFYRTMMEVIDTTSPIEADKTGNVSVAKGDGTLVQVQKVAEGKSNRLAFRGNVRFPKVYESYNLQKDYDAGYRETANSPWYVMAMIGQEASKYSPDRLSAEIYYGSSPEDPTNKYNRATGVKNALLPTLTDDSGLNLLGSVAINSIPFISNWRPITLEGNRGSSFDLQFRPQGTLIQVELAPNIASDNKLQFEMRRYGIASNVLDFAGQYDLTPDKVYGSFMGRDDSGVGIPEWKPEAPSMRGYTLHHLDGATDELGEGERPFPWHLPVFSHPETPTWGRATAYAGARTVDVTDMTMAEFSPLAADGNSVRNAPVEYYYQGTAGATTPPTGKQSWIFPRYGVKRNYIYLWAMPRAKQPAEPATYVWTSVYSETSWDDMFSYNSSLKPSTDVRDKTSQIATLTGQRQMYLDAIDEANTDGDAVAVAKLRSAYSTWESRTKATTNINTYKAKYDELYGAALPLALKHYTTKSQPMVVLYQTNATFNNKIGKVSHIQSALTTDLIFTKVVYKQENGQNYSLVQLLNPTALRIDLNQYAIARMIPSPDGSYLRYRRADGSGTDKLSEAAILPLRSMISVKSSPFSGGEFPSWTDHIGGDYDKRAISSNPDVRTSSTVFLESTYPNSYQGINKEVWRTQVPTTTSFPDVLGLLNPRQAVVIGASGYINLPPTANWWNTLNDQMLTAQARRKTLLYHYRYADGVKKADGTFDEGTLDVQPTDGFVLLKTNGQGGWQIIDATAPIGRNAMGSYVDYTQYKTWLASQISQGKDAYFAVARNYGDYFPVLPPYSTARRASSSSVEPDNWSLVTDEAKFYLGGEHTDQKIMGWVGTYFRLTRTPMDPAGRYATYWNNIPSQTRP